MSSMPQPLVASPALDRADVKLLRNSMLNKAAELRSEAQRIGPGQPEEAAGLQRIADRIEVYMRDYLGG